MVIRYNVINHCKMPDNKISYSETLTHINHACYVCTITLRLKVKKSGMYCRPRSFVDRSPAELRSLVSETPDNYKICSASRFLNVQKHILSTTSPRYLPNVQIDHFYMKIKCAVFWNRKGVILVDFLSCSNRQYVVSSRTTLKNLGHACQYKTQDLLVMMTCCYSTRPHAARLSQDVIEYFSSRDLFLVLNIFSILHMLEIHQTNFLL